MKEVTSKLKVKEVLEFLRRGQDCKAEFFEDGTVWILPVDAFGYPDRIMSQEFNTYDLTDAETEEVFINWLEDCYKNRELETDNHLITIEIIK